MSMVKRISLLIIVCLFIGSVTTACYDAVEVDDEVYALVLGLDKGITNKIRVTIQYPTYKNSGGGSGGGQDKKAGGGGMEGSNEAAGTNIHTIEAPSILEALDMYGMAISRRISLMHMKNLILSEDLVKEGIQPFLAPLARFRQARRVVNIAVVKGTAQDYIRDNTSNIGESLSKAMELMSVQADNTSFFPRVTFYNFYTALLSTYEQGFTAYSGINDFKQLPEGQQKTESPLNLDNGYEPGRIPRSGVAKREFAGTAVFKGDKMVGTLNSEETRYFLMITGKFKRGIIDIQDEELPEYVIPMDFRLSRKPVIKGYFKKGRPVVSVSLELEADIGSIQSRIDYEDRNKIEKLNDDAEKYIRERVTQVIGKVRDEYKSDIFGFGQQFAGYFSNIGEWEKFNWNSHFQEAGVNVKANVNIRRTGLMWKSSRVTDK